MRKIFIAAIGVALLIATGCANKDMSETKVATAEQMRMQTHGMVSWYELMTTDAEAAKKFYSKLFGWALEDVQGGEMPYTIVNVGGRQMGGMMTLPPGAKGAPPHWGVYVTVDDVDATAKLAESLGARILVAPRDIPDVGRFCVIKDPQGAVISAITYKIK